MSCYGFNCTELNTPTHPQIDAYTCSIIVLAYCCGEGNKRILTSSTPLQVNMPEQVLAYYYTSAQEVL